MLYCGTVESVNSRTIPNQKAKELAVAEKILRKISKNIKDITGQKFGRLTAISLIDSIEHSALWEFQCECGKKETLFAVIVKGRRHAACKECTTHYIRLPHATQLAYLYHRMYSRCYRPENNRYYAYGERGIKICDEWLFNRRKFYRWALDNGYAPGLQIDRINNDGNYEPSNCRFVNIFVQANNKRSNKLLTLNGKTLNIHQWETLYNLPKGIVGQRLKRGRTVEEAILGPIDVLAQQRAFEQHVNTKKRNPQ